MKKKIKIPAKINLTLDVVGVKDGYHELRSLVTSVDIFDTIYAKDRSDEEITVRFAGLSCGVSGENSLAGKAAELFKNRFGGKGFDIIIKRNIPSGGGLGGSSADAAGVLACLKKLRFSEMTGEKKGKGTGAGARERELEAELASIANSLGSDTAYMLNGGYAVLSGRGENVQRLAESKKLYYLIVTGEAGVSSAECYKKYDEIGDSFAPVTSAALCALSRGGAKELSSFLKNDLYPAAAEILPETAERLHDLSVFGAAAMTGSGSAVYGLYDSAQECDAVYRKLKSKYGKRLFKAKTVL